MNALLQKYYYGLFDDEKKSLAADLGALALRLAFGGLMLAAHGYGKLMSFGEKRNTFPDPLGIGNTASLAGAVGAEFFCALALMLGLFTRLMTIPLIFTMVIAAFVVHSADPFQRKELAIVYLCAYVAILLIGPGRFSLDALLSGRKK